MPTINEAFKAKYNRNYNKKDIDKIYELFEASLMAGITKHTDIKPYVIETVNKLKEMKIKIGSTTGYTDMMMEPVLKRAKEQGYCPDGWYSPDATNHLGRPYPYMIFKNIQTLNVTSVKNVIKVGDTVSDIKEGLNAGVITIGVIEGSSTLGLNEEEFNNLDKIKKIELVEKVKQIYLDAGADYVINNLSELIDIINKYN